MMAALVECSICGAQGLPERIQVHACRDFLKRRQRCLTVERSPDDEVSAGRPTDSQEVVR
jgi:hypothetical protein